MFGLAHGAVLLAPAEDAFDHRTARLRHAIAIVPRGAGVDGAAAAPDAGAVVLRHVRRDVDGAQVGDMIGRVVGSSLADPLRMNRITPSSTITSFLVG